MLELVAGLMAFIVTWLVVPGLRRLALHWQFVDIPNQRKIHQTPLPLLGGAGMFAGFLVATLIFAGVLPDSHKAYVGLILGALLLFGIGLVDDYYKSRGKDFPAAPRFILQVFAAGLVAAFGGTVRGFTIPFAHNHYVLFPSFLSILVTIVWIVGVINVFNFLDGLDGLAAGIAAISGATLIFIALAKNEVASALWAACLTGSALGFLRHNFYPARIIMGDAGSTLLGFLLASISVIGAFKSATVVSIFVPVLALGVPIFDGIRVVGRRVLHGQPPHKPDKTHGHHWLLQSGLSQVQTVAVMYLLSLCFSLASVIVVLLQK